MKPLKTHIFNNHGVSTRVYKADDVDELVLESIRVLNCVCERHEKVGGDARKMGIPFGIYKVCRDFLIKLEEMVIIP